MGGVVVPVPDGVLVQTGSGLALTHIFMEPLSELVTEEPLDLLLVTIGCRMEMNCVVT